MENSIYIVLTMFRFYYFILSHRGLDLQIPRGSTPGRFIVRISSRVLSSKTESVFSFSLSRLLSMRKSSLNIKLPTLSFINMSIS